MTIKPYVITLAQVKVYLGLSDTSKDTLINAYIPVVSDDLCRVNGICNQDFLLEGTATTAGTTTLSDVSLTSDEWALLYDGSSILVGGEDAVISQYSESAETITLEEAVTGSGTDQELIIRNFPTGSKPIVSQMISTQIKNTSDTASYGKEITSRSVGPLSVSFKNNPSGAVNAYGYPEAIIAGLRTIIKPRFC